MAKKQRVYFSLLCSGKKKRTKKPDKNINGIEIITIKTEESQNLLQIKFKKWRNWAICQILEEKMINLWQEDSQCT